MIAREQLERWRELAAKATAGPWHLDPADSHRCLDHIQGPANKTVMMAAPCGYENSYFVVSEEDAAFIVEARSAVPELLDEIDRLEARQQELLATIVRLTNETPYPEEIKGWVEQRAKLIAEIGTLKATIAERDADIVRLREALAAQGVVTSNRSANEKPFKRWRCAGC
jgi:hypothetical protein